MFGFSYRVGVSITLTGQFFNRWWLHLPLMFTRYLVLCIFHTKNMMLLHFPNSHIPPPTSLGARSITCDFWKTYLFDYCIFLWIGFRRWVELCVQVKILLVVQIWTHDIWIWSMLSNVMCCLADDVNSREVDGCNLWAWGPRRTVKSFLLADVVLYIWLFGQRHKNLMPHMTLGHNHHAYMKRRS